MNAQPTKEQQAAALLLAYIDNEVFEFSTLKSALDSVQITLGIRQQYERVLADRKNKAQSLDIVADDATSGLLKTTFSNPFSSATLPSRVTSTHEQKHKAAQDWNNADLPVDEHGFQHVEKYDAVAAESDAKAEEKAAVPRDADGKFDWRGLTLRAIKETTEYKALPPAAKKSKLKKHELIAAIEQHESDSQPSEI